MQSLLASLGFIPTTSRIFGQFDDMIRTSYYGIRHMGARVVYLVHL